MEKIKITVNQENVLKEFNDIWIGKTTNERFQIFLGAKKIEVDTMSRLLKPLTEISDQDFFFMLHGWYKVEKPKFKVGDWVYGSVGVKKRYYKVTQIAELDERKLCLSYADNYQENFEKVTEEWKIVLLELGREKPEFKKGDKIITIFSDHLTCEKDGSNNFEKTFMNNKVEYFYPIESRVEFKQ